MASKSRIEFIDLAKGLCILLVVLSHAASICGIEEGSNRILTICQIFRMPLYFFLSGLFFKAYENFNGFLKRKTNKLLIPFLFFYIITSIIIPNVLDTVGLHLFSSSSLGISSIWAFAFKETFPNAPIWFLLCLFLLNCLFYILYIIANHYSKWKLTIIIAGSLILGACGYTLGIKGINLPFYIDSAMTSMPFFVCGYLFNRFTNILQPNSLDKYSPLIIFLLLISVSYLGTSVYYIHNDYPETNFLTLYLGGMAGTLMVIYLAKLIKHIKIISYLGRYSIMILCTHYELIQVCKILFSRLSQYSAWLTVGVIMIVLAVLYYYLIIPLMIKYMPHVTAQKDVIRIEISTECQK